LIVKYYFPKLYPFLKIKKKITLFYITFIYLLLLLYTHYIFNINIKLIILPIIYNHDWTISQNNKNRRKWSPHFLQVLDRNQAIGRADQEDNPRHKEHGSSKRGNRTDIPQQPVRWAIPDLGRAQRFDHFVTKKAKKYILIHPEPQ
jgi:hypothetical protein